MRRLLFFAKFKKTFIFLLTNEQKCIIVLLY